MSASTHYFQIAPTQIKTVSLVSWFSNKPHVSSYTYSKMHYQHNIVAIICLIGSRNVEYGL